MKFSLFSTHDNRYDHKKSLYENLEAMCSLPFLKVRSEETKVLFNTIKKCRLIDPLFGFDIHRTVWSSAKAQKATQQPNDKDMQREICLHNIAVLELAKNATNYWHLNLQKNGRTSTRQKLVDQYYKALEAKQTQYIEEEKRLFEEQQQEEIIALQDWTYPLSSPLPARLCTNAKSEIQHYLRTDKEKKFFDFIEDKLQTIKNHINKAPVPSCSLLRRITQAHLIIPFLNVAMDFDCFNSMFESITTCWSLMPVF